MSVYKGEKLVAGGSIDTHFVRRPAWNQAVEITAADLTAGYKAPADGMIVGTVVPSTGSGTLHILCNGIILSAGNNNGTWASFTQPHTIVNAGDVISATSKANTFDSTLSFVPFEDSTVSESDIEVVTPEYIRNQNILSDWEDITISTSASSRTVMPYDGFIYLSTGHTAVLHINTTPFWISNHSNVSGNGACMVAFRKGDKVYIDIDKDPNEKVAYYKLRDYTGR